MDTTYNVSPQSVLIGATRDLNDRINDTAARVGEFLHETVDNYARRGDSIVSQSATALNSVLVGASFHDSRGPDYQLLFDQETAGLVFGTTLFLAWARSMVEAYRYNNGLEDPESMSTAAPLHSMYMALGSLGAKGTASGIELTYLPAALSPLLAAAKYIEISDKKNSLEGKVEDSQE